MLRPRLYPVGAHHPCTARPPNPAGTRRREPAIYEAFKALAQHQKDVSSTVKVTAFDDVGSRQPLEPGTCHILAFPEGRPCCAALPARGLLPPAHAPLLRNRQSCHVTSIYLSWRCLQGCATAMCLWPAWGTWWCARWQTTRPPCRRCPKTWRSCRLGTA